MRCFAYPIHKPLALLRFYCSTSFNVIAKSTRWKYYVKFALHFHRVFLLKIPSPIAGHHHPCSFLYFTCRDGLSVNIPPIKKMCTSISIRRSSAIQKFQIIIIIDNFRSWQSPFLQHSPRQNPLPSTFFPI